MSRINQQFCNRVLLAPVKPVLARMDFPSQRGSYFERHCPDQPIQIDFNFNIDLEELGQLDDVG